MSKYIIPQRRPHFLDKDIYYSPSKEKAIETQKKNMNMKTISFENMLIEMKKRIDNEDRRLEILKNLGYTKIESNNIVPEENKYLSIKTITKNELNNMLSANKSKANKYIELLRMDLDEYYARFCAKIKSKELCRLYIDNAKYGINLIIEEHKESKKYYEIKKKIKDKLSELHMPPIYFDLFRTRKGIRDLRSQHSYVRNIDYTFMETNINRSIRSSLNININQNNNINLIDLLGIKKIIKYNKNGNKLTNVNDLKYQTIFEYIKEFMIDIKIPIEEIIDPLFIRTKDFLKLKISYKIFESFNSNISLYTSFNSKKKIASGYSGIVFRNNNDILKYEDLRLGNPIKKYVNNHNKYFPSISYLFNNYIVFTTLIQSLIQNYLYNIYQDGVPEFINYSLSYNDRLSLTRMKLAFEENEYVHNENKFVGTFHNFMVIESESLQNNENFIKNILLILIEICKLLEIYQNGCYFVHGDLHASNIMVKCNFNEMHLVQNIHIKLIDFQFSSIILKINGDKKIFKDFGFGTYKLVEQCNPYISSIWNKLDILYFISTIFYNLNNLKDNKNIKELFLKLSDIFNISIDIYKTFEEYSLENKFLSFISSYKKSNMFKNKNEEYTKFIPSILKTYLHE